MKIIIIIEQSRSNLYEYTVRGRKDESSVYHTKLAEGFTTVEDANEFAAVIQQGAEFAGTSTIIAASYEIAEELPELPVYENCAGAFTFESVWGKLV